MVYLNCPDFDLGLPVYRKIFELKKERPEMFYEDTKIASVFGNFPGCVWNGGRIVYGTPPIKQSMEEIVNIYNNEFGIPIRFTFTNPILEETDCYDRYSNIIASCAHNGKNEILVVSPILEKYLRKNYPNYKYIRSILSTEDDGQYHSQPEYDLMVMKRVFNNDWNYLDTIPQEERKKIEFLCDDPCLDECPNLYDHYRTTGKNTLAFEYQTNFLCPIWGNLLFDSLKTRRTYIPRELIPIYTEKGFEQFKISGRGYIPTIICTIIPYLFKPEYHADAYLILFSLFF